METIIFDRWWTSHQSLAREFLRIFRICVMPWNMSENPQSNTVWEDKLTWFKSSPQYRTLDTIDGEPWKSSGIFSWDSPHCSSATKSKSSCRKWAKSQKNSQDGSSSCRCSTTSHGDLKTMNRNAMLTPTSFQYMQKDFHQEDGHSSDLDQKRSGVLLILTDHKENGTESLNWWWSNLQKADTQFSVPRVHCPEERLKAKEVENYQCTSVLMGIRLKLSFAQLFMLISSVFTEQSQICVKNVKLAMLEQGDLFWQDNLTHCLCQVWWRHTHTFDRWSCARRRSIAKIPRTSWKAFTTIVWLNFVLMQDSWQQLRSDSTSWQKTLKNSHNSQIQWLVVSTLCQKMKHHLTQKVGFEGTLRLDPYWKSQPATYKVNLEWKIRIESINKDNSHLWVRISHGLNKLVTDLSNNKDDHNEQETSQMQFEDCALKKMYLLLRADQRIKQNHKDVFLPAHPQKLYPSGKELGPILNQKIIRQSLIQCRSNWALFFVMVVYLEKMMERLNSGEWKNIFETILNDLNIGLVKSGRVEWQEAEETRKDFNIVLIHQDKKFFISDQDAVLLILQYRTMY